MKKAVVLLIVCVCLLTSCTLSETITTHTVLPNDVADNTMETIVHLIEANDTDSFIQLFSPSVRKENQEFEQSVKDLFSFVKGNIQSVTNASEGGVSVEKSSDKGKVYVIYESVFTLKTDMETYHICVKECVRDDFQKANVGLLSFHIINSRDWQNDYLYRGNKKLLTGICVEGNV